MKLKILGFIAFAFLLFYSFTLVKGELNCLDPASITSNTDREICINQIETLKNQYLPAQTTNKKNLATLQSQLNDLNKRIQAMTAQLSIFEKNIRQREESMAYTQKIFEEKTVNNYRFIRTYDPIMPFLAANASTAFRELIFQQKAAESDRQSIESYAKDLDSLKKDKATLEKNKTDIAAIQKQVAEKTSFLASEVAKVDAYLATLTAKQQDFLAAKLESLGLSRSAYNMKGGCTDDRNVDPGFSGPRIAFFTFGVPNRVGLNQFGAKGRAEAGENNPENILRAYYNFDQIGTVDQSTTIHVLGTNEFGQSFDDYWPIEEYLKHLYEMPTGWPGSALRAQAIAARSYALRVQKDKGYVKPSQADQVVKRELNDGNWISAVTDTSGRVMLQGGLPIKAWFSSTHGGYAFNSGDVWISSTSWTKRMVDSPSSIGSFSDLFNNAYDKNSPIFYCDWGARASYNKTAWLKPEELADIVNAVLLVEKDGSTKSHLYQTDKANPEGTDTWDVGRVKNELGGSAFNTITNISVGVDFGTGRTTTVTVSGDAASQTINGDDFKNYFNLRAPANIQIVGPLFNVEKR